MGRRQPGTLWWPLTLVTLGHFVVDFYMAVAPAIMPTLAARLGLSLTLAASVLTVGSVFSSFSQPVFGYFIDRWATSRWLVLSAAWTGLFISLIGVAPSYWALVFLALAGGLGSALYHPLGSVTASALAGAGNRGLAMSIYSTGGSLGYSLAPILVVPLVAGAGLVGMTWLALIGFLCAVLLQAFGVGRVKLRAGDGGAHQPGVASFWGEIAPRLRTLILLNVVVGLRAWAQMAVIYLIPFYYSQRLNETGASYLLTTFLMAGTLGGLIGGFLSDRLGRKRVLIGTTLLAMPFLFLAFIGTGWWLWGMMFVGGFFLQAAFPATIVFAQELIPNSAGFASGLTMGLAWGLGAFGLTLTGYIGDQLGMLAGLNSVLVLLMLAAVASAPLPMVMTAGGSASGGEGV